MKICQVIFLCEFEWIPSESRCIKMLTLFFNTLILQYGLSICYSSSENISLMTYDYSFNTQHDVVKNWYCRMAIALAFMTTVIRFKVPLWLFCTLHSYVSVLLVIFASGKYHEISVISNIPIQVHCKQDANWWIVYQEIYQTLHIWFKQELLIWQIFIVSKMLCYMKESVANLSCKMFLSPPHLYMFFIYGYSETKDNERCFVSVKSKRISSNFLYKNEKRSLQIFCCSLYLYIFFWSRHIYILLD